MKQRLMTGADHNIDNEKKAKAMGEALSVDDQMKISREAAKKRNPNPDHKLSVFKMMKESP